MKNLKKAIYRQRNKFFDLKLESDRLASSLDREINLFPIIEGFFCQLLERTLWLSLCLITSKKERWDLFYELKEEEE